MGKKTVYATFHLFSISLLQKRRVQKQKSLSGVFVIKLLQRSCMVMPCWSNLQKIMCLEVKSGRALKVSPRQVLNDAHHQVNLNCVRKNMKQTNVILKH